VQDVDRSQLDLAVLLAGAERRIFLVGDADQTSFASGTGCTAGSGDRLDPRLYEIPIEGKGRVDACAAQSPAEGDAIRERNGSRRCRDEGRSRGGAGCVTAAMSAADRHGR